MIITYITKIEDWEDRGDEIQQIVTRTFMAKTFTVVVQLFSYIQLVDPFLLTGGEQSVGFGTLTWINIRNSTSPIFDADSHKCRADMWAQTFFLQVVVEFGTRVGMGFFTAFMGEISKLTQSEGSKPVSLVCAEDLINRDLVITVV